MRKNTSRHIWPGKVTNTNNNTAQTVLKYTKCSIFHSTGHARAVCTKRHRKALKLLDFLSVQKRIYAKLTPLTPKIQAHYRVTEIGTCLKSRCRFFPYLRFFLPFPCCNCGFAFPRWLIGLFKYLDSLSISISETNCSLESLS